MENIKSATIVSFHDTIPIIWIRCIDDMFCVIERDNIDSFQKHFNIICKYQIYS